MTRLEQTGKIFDIQRYSLHDGPGLRTLVFFKGCPLTCLWCSNPESQWGGIEYMWEISRCTACGTCLDVCPEGAVTVDGETAVRIDRKICTLCDQCLEHCPSRALSRVGRTETVGSILEEVLKDMPFFRRSGGGVTLGGGEPTYQPDFAFTLLTACRKENLHTAVETCGYTAWDNLKRLSTVTDLFLFDIKHVDSKQHRHLTGVENKSILSNLKRLSGIHSSIILRYPIIPSCNDGKDDIAGLIELAASIDGVNRIELLPYHRFGEKKYANLGRTYPLSGTTALADDIIQGVVDACRSAGLECEALH